MKTGRLLDTIRIDMINVVKGEAIYADEVYPAEE